jgi:hypothetical protein
VLAVSVLSLGILALPALQLELALPGPATASVETTERRAYDLLAEGFGAGFNGPLLIVVDLANATDRTAAVAAVGQSLQGLDGIAAVSPANLNPAGDTAIFNVIPTTGPSDLLTEALVDEIRALSVPGVWIGVTGLPALNFDVSAKLGAALLPYMLVVVGLALVLLLVVFRSILVPLKATLGFLLTIGATFGAVVAVFQWGWLASLIGLDSTGPVMSMLPIFMIGIVFGLAMDYQVFLVTRMREEFVHGADPDRGRLRREARRAVVTAAAPIAISVFGGRPRRRTDHHVDRLRHGAASTAFVVRPSSGVHVAVAAPAGGRPTASSNVDVEGRHSGRGRIHATRGRAAAAARSDEDRSISLTQSCTSPAPTDTSGVQHRSGRSGGAAARWSARPSVASRPSIVRCRPCSVPDAGPATMAVPGFRRLFPVLRRFRCRSRRRQATAIMMRNPKPGRRTAWRILAIRRSLVAAAAAFAA